MIASSTQKIRGNLPFEVKRTVNDGERGSNGSDKFIFGLGFALSNEQMRIGESGCDSQPRTAEVFWKL